MALTAAEREEAQKLFEAGMPNHAMARKFGVSKNVIVGLAARGDWDGREIRPAPETVFDRMQRLEDKMKAVLAETKDIGRLPRMVATTPAKGTQQREV